MSGEKDRRKDGQTVFYGTLPATARAPVNIYKSTFNTINDITNTTIICFNWREQLLNISLH